ncbi:MAG: T9SS type A sorting domain-containing protein [Bacteroidetes bacterium]|nr:T9SS type A sorting domain-containing protein [Bacteroidota bacterium]
MKKNLLIFALGAGVVALATGFTMLHPTGIAFETGSPYDGSDCSNCHGGGASIPNANLVASPAFGGSGTNLTYVPGTTYTITVTQSGYPYFGLDVETLNSTSATSAGNAGTMAALSSNCKSGSTPTNIMHRAPIASSASAQYTWVAPASGTAYLYAAVLGANGDGTDNGDQVVDLAYTLTPTSSAGIENYQQANTTQLSVFPNPSAGNFTVSYHLIEKAEVSVKLYNLNGELITELLNQTQNAGKQSMNVSLPASLAKGAYFVRLFVNQQVSTEKLIVF